MRDQDMPREVKSIIVHLLRLVHVQTIMAEREGCQRDGSGVNVILLDKKDSVYKKEAEEQSGTLVVNGC